MLEFNKFIILGCTLWTNIIDDEKSEVNEYMNDYKLIHNFHVETNNELHRKDFNWLRNQLLKLKLKSKPIIVITHHLPDYKLIDWTYCNSTINSAFANQDCELLLKLADYWICGHTHKFAKLKIDNCICICNPIGYENENTNVVPHYINL
jgi:predicted phosphodiesterase